ncbi:MAG: hypothetical protein ACKV2T_20430 [Kofleriaceae bacterium]
MVRFLVAGGLLIGSGAQAQPTTPEPAKPAPTKPERGPAPAKLPEPKPTKPMPPTSRKPNVPEVVSATEIVKLTATGGFVDDAIAVDDTRIAYVVADAASKSELHVYTFATKAEVLIDLAPVTLTPVELAFVGKRVLVIGRTEDGNRIAALVELDPTAKKPVVYKLAPAVDMTLVTRDGAKRLAVHAVRSGAAGAIKHEVQIVSLETGKRVGAMRTLEVAEDGTNAKLGFKVNHWSDGYSKAHGIKQGEWDRKENERAPDFEATYDVATGKFVDKQKITDLFEQRRRFQTLADATSNGRTDIVRMSWDNATVQLWRAGKLRTVELDQAITQYDPASLQGVISPDGSAWILFKVDPTNQEAVARKKADPQYVDVFRVAADGKTATRKARVLAHDVRMRFGAVGEKFWLVERNAGFERGGKWVALYQPQ